MESPNSLYNNINNSSKDGLETENIVIPSNFLISTKEIIARFPHNKRVGHYLLGRKLGEGSFAKVKEGLHTLTGQKVAIKVIDKKKAKEDAYVSKNMRREGKLLQMIIHPNIIQLYELMETENSYYLVTELCEGGDLMDYICARKYLSEVCTRKFIRQIISAVDYLHRIGILHRDLKIENLLLDKNLNIKLIDFGLSNYTKSELCITQCGSPAYAAPELLAHKKYGSKVDVWSIGVNMYAMLTGNLPFTVEPFNIKSLYNKMMKNEMNAIPEHLSKTGEELLRKLLNPDPLKRISLKEAMEHAWLNEGYANPLKPFPYPNKPTEEQVNPTILRYMNSNMEFNVNEIAENIKSNKPSSSLATYYLLLNKVKTMLMKMEPKKDKLKPRIETKPVVKELKQIKTIVQTIQQPGQPQQILGHTTTTTTTTATANSQSPIPRTIKTQGANTTISTTITATNNQNTFTLIRNKTDMPNKYGGTRPDKNVSPIPNSTTTTTTSVYTSNSNNMNNNNLNNANISNTNPANTFAGAIKNLTQKYKTMHLNTSIETNHLTGSINTNLNNATGNAYNMTTINNTSPNSNSISTSTSNNSFPYNKNNNNTYLGNGHMNSTLTGSIDHGINNNTSNSGCEGNSSNNSESLSLSDERQNMKNNFTNRNSLNTTAATVANNNTTVTPTLGKVTNITNAEWTQMIKLNTGKTKSDLNNNELNISTNSNNCSKDQFTDASIIHLAQSTTNGIVSTQMPVISFPNSSSTSNGSFLTNRLNKNPFMQKISSPITLPAIDANNNNNGDKSSSQ